MKNSTRNRLNEAIKRHERRQGPPAVSKYAAKTRPAPAEPVKSLETYFAPVTADE